MVVSNLLEFLFTVSFAGILSTTAGKGAAAAEQEAI